MSKLMNSFPGQNSKKLPALGSDNSSSGNLVKTPVPRDSAAKLLGSRQVGPGSVPLKFGTLHTKSASPSSSGSSWTSLLSTASGGASGALGGGLFSASGFGFVGKLISLFGGGKSVPAAPVAFQSPVSQQNSLNITIPGAANSVSLGVHSMNGGSQNSGIYQHTGSTVADHQGQTSQVVQIVKQALLTSSSLNDVISEI